MALTLPKEPSPCIPITTSQVIKEFDNKCTTVLTEELKKELVTDELKNAEAELRTYLSKETVDKVVNKQM